MSDDQALDEFVRLLNLEIERGLAEARAAFNEPDPEPVFAPTSWQVVKQLLARFRR